MGETNDRYDLGELKPDQSLFLDHDLFDMPEGKYRLYAERVPDKPLNVRMADRFNDLFPSCPKWRMRILIDELGLVERSKITDPIGVPEWVQRWLDDTIGPIEHGKVWALKAWVVDALIGGAVRAEKPDVPDDVKKAATFVADRGWGVGSVENVDTIVRWVLEQVGDSNG